MNEKKPDLFDAMLKFFEKPEPQHDIPKEPTIDIYPDIADTGFTSPDPDKQALPQIEPNITDLLLRIAKATEAVVNTDEPVYTTRFITLDTGVGEASLEIPKSFRNIYIPPVPRDVRIYAGYGRTFFLTEIPAGMGLQATLPIVVNGLVLDWDAGDKYEQFTVYMMSEKMEVNLIGGTGGSSGGAAVLG